ncbi:MAG TPA: mannose-1-phosphate guanylyltransferase [Candidatus Binataceae bacterium]|nr:mannose-1-phosphate guanylyltransferase [Candidatus Binataceae bacterium]
MKIPRPAPDAAVLIIAGGRGTRFWPESRSNRPKPLFSIDGRRSLLAETIARMSPLIPRERVYVLASADQAPLFRPVLRRLLPARNLIIEPEGRGTAVAIAYGTSVIARRMTDQVVVAVMPADHFVAPAEGFQRTLRDAIALAAKDAAIVVIGIKPTRPETGYGYQEIGRAVGRGFRLARFVEKPRPAAALKMVQSGNFLWNAGMFVMTAATLAAELEQHAPKLAAAMSGFGAMRGVELERRYRTLDFDSFDRVVAEKSRNVLGVRARFQWHDVGSWEGLWEAMRGRGTVVLSGNAVAVGAERVLARARDRLMVLVGVSDLVAVDAGDAILIARKSESQDVRRVIEELKRRGLGRYT